MTTLTQDRPVLSPPSLLAASGSIVWRNLIHIKRMPEMLLDVTVQSVMFVLLFVYVFGGAIQVPGTDYRDFLVPGIMVQTIVFSSAIVAMGLTNDLQKGIVDRLKSLPISRASVLVGRSISSLIHSSIGIAVMGLTGVLVGWRIRTNVFDAVLGVLLLLLFGFAMIWLGIWVGSMMRTVESVQGLMFTVMFPLTFVANTFAPPASMPAWLRVVAEWNPVSSLAQACRELWGNAPAVAADAAWPLHHPVLMSVLWPVLLTAIFAPLALRAFKRRSRD